MKNIVYREKNNLLHFDTNLLILYNLRFGLVSLFMAYQLFLGYLMPKPFS